MRFFPRLVTTFGLILLAHAAYSTHEHSILHANLPSLPLDIMLETLIALVFVSIGLAVGTERLKPISWSVWAGEIEKEGGAENPFRGLEDRIGFWDVRAKRKEFANWVRKGDLPVKM